MEPDDSRATRATNNQNDAASPAEQTWEAGDRERRLRALRNLAGQQLGEAASSTSAPGEAPASPSTERSSAPSLAPYRPRRRRPPLWLAGVLVLLAIAVLVAGIVVLRAPHSPTVAKHLTGPSLSINPANDLLACPVDAEWSPNSAYIAMLGYRIDCEDSGSPQSVTGQLDIYDATSGRLLTSSQLDQQILSQAAKVVSQDLPSGSIFTPGSIFPSYIDYTGLLWSPDSTFLAVTFDILNQPYQFPAPNSYSSSASQPAAAVAGVWISGRIGPNSSFAASRTLAMPFTLGVDPLQRPGIEWDLAQNKPVSADVSLPPAIGYRWGADDLLRGLDLMGPDQAPPVVTSQQIGMPDGGAYFSTWQPGNADLGYSYFKTSLAGQPSEVQAKPVPNLYLWYSNFPILSPDGRFLIVPAIYGGRMIIPGRPDVPLSALKATGQDQAALLPFHDAAQQQIYLHQPGAALAWRPDGAVLAALVGQVQRGAHINFYNCVSGALLRTIAVPAHVGGETNLSLAFLGPNPNGIYLRWSPNGKRLLLYNPYGDGKIDVWNASGH